MSPSIPIPTDSPDQIRIPVEQIVAVIEKILVKKSLFQFDATVAAQRLVEADLYGIPSHGCGRILDLVSAIDCGDVDPRARVLIVDENDVLSILDGGRALGHLAATKGVEAAIAKAKSSGVGISCIGNSQTLGALSVPLRMASEKGLIAIGFSSTGGATVAAPGTTIGVVGNAAFAYAIPRKDSPPIVFDTACGVESWGKLSLLKRFGVSIPDEIAFDTEGQPTSDIEAAAALMPLGGELGFGLSLLGSIVAGPLAGGQMAIRKKGTDSSDDSQHFFIVLDIEHFTETDRFQKRVDVAVAEMREKANEGCQSFRLPGEQGADSFKEFSTTGIPLHCSIVEEIKQLAQSLGVEVSF
ncbi:Ldh family oxidoreductase [Thalassoglobus sp. JC818]|uniref:Ldh family oxidoreductase n=1 Tax=Thalassoglobus sp. JC818 TaxID=3232136 RepID=UPI00345A57F2